MTILDDAAADALAHFGQMPETFLRHISLAAGLHGDSHAAIATESDHRVVRG